MKQIAIIVASQHGQTAKIGCRMAAILGHCNIESQLFPLQRESDLASIPVEEFDGFIVGGSVYAGRFSNLLQSWTKRHHERLNERPTAFYTVSLNAADPRPTARKEDVRLISEFLRKTGLKPAKTASLIGAVRYLEYGWLIRRVMKRICAAAGGPTDTHQNHELTDWDAVDTFAESFSTLFVPARIGASVQ